jgi:hypothetical protein
MTYNIKVIKYYNVICTLPIGFMKRVRSLKVVS